MDTVRFGRILGQGARHAAKTLVSAVDAATAPNPGQSAAAARANTSTPPSPRAPSPRPQTPIILPPATLRSKASTAAATTRGLGEGTRRFGRAVWAPAVRLSGVLWLELTGVFFALFALVAAIAAWRLRPALHAAAASDDHTRLLFAAGMVLVFGYFSLSSFLKANRRSRRP